MGARERLGLIEAVGKGQMKLKVDDNPKHVRLSGSVTPFVHFQCDLPRQHDVSRDRSEQNKIRPTSFRAEYLRRYSSISLLKEWLSPEQLAQ